MMSWAPTIACLIGAFFMMLYPLGAARMKLITQELAEREAK
jgi:Na+/melibiose symporter-like transporter